MDIENLEDQYQTLSAAVSRFLQDAEHPTTRSSLFGYLSISTKLELKLINLKTQLSLTLAGTRAELDQTLRDLNNDLPDRATQGARDRLKWEPVPSDLRRIIECLEAYLAALEDFKWLLQGQKRTFERFVEHVN